MTDRINILIADRNAHIREFLKREMTAEGYSVSLADSGNEVIKKIYADDALDLLILDPEIPCADELSLLKRLANRIPSLPVILHVCSSGFEHLRELPNAAAVVEKGGNSIDALKKAIENCGFRHIKPARPKNGMNHV